MITFVYGKPGSGKSAYITYICQQAMSKNRHVFSNYPIKNKYVTSYPLTRDMFFKGDFPNKSLLAIDEAGSFDWFNSRDWKSFSKEEFQFFSTHRHNDIDIVMGVQDVSRIDVSLRSLGEYYVLVKRFPFNFVKLTYYFAFEDLGLKAEQCFYKPKGKIKYLGKKILTSYDTSYFKNLDNQDPGIDPYALFKVKYKRKVKQMYDDLQGMIEAKKYQKFKKDQLKKDFESLT